MFYRIVSVFFVAVAVSWVLSPPAPAADSHQGKVVETSAGKLVMTDMEGKNQHPMEVPASATVTREGEEAQLTDLQAGDTITVTTAKQDGKAMVTKVEAKAGEM
jgi:Cu/Ag efflux protein CusF